MPGSDYDRAAMEVTGVVAELPPELRNKRLDELCGGDQQLRARVESLLLELDDNDAVADANDPEVDPDFSFPHDHGVTPSWYVPAGGRTPINRIGPYRLLRRIGIGGMSEVYEAEQDKPRRRIALKLIHPLRITGSQTLRRFEFEVEVLGRLDHPGIARVYDAGTASTPYGPQPYFAMELVRGRRLDHWMHLTQPHLQQRLRMLIDICDAVQHAHQRRVIHRDLKPSNILVTEDGKPKVLDFGVAAAIDFDGATPANVLAETLHTATGQIVGTLQYMSPEQASGDTRHLDTRSDVYALGVIAYQLLAERLPYEVSDKSFPEAMRVIRELEPPRLGTIDRSLAGDIETIVFKALSKDRERRYASSAELAADVRRFLEYEPITARRPSALYQMKQFARRHTALVAAASIALLALAIGALVASVGLVRARRAYAAEAQLRREAETANTTYRKVNEFLDAMLSAPNPEQAQGRPVLVRDVIDRAASDIQRRFEGQPEVEAAVRVTLAETYSSLGMAEQAHAQASRALQTFQQRLGENHDSTMTAQSAMGNALLLLGRTSEAASYFQRAYELAGTRLGGSDPRTLRAAGNYAQALHELGRLDDAASVCRPALGRSRALSGAGAEGVTLHLLNTFANVLSDQGHSDEAEPLLSEAVKRSSSALGDDHPTTIAALNNHAQTLDLLGRREEAEQAYRKAVARARKVFGEDHPQTMLMWQNLAMTLSRLERNDEAASILRDVLSRATRSLGADHPQTIQLVSNLGYVTDEMGRHADAEPLLRDALARRRRVLGENHPHTLHSMNNLAGALEGQGKLDDAEALYREVMERRRAVLGAGHPSTLRAMNNFGGLIYDRGRLAEAEPVLADLYAGAGGSSVAPRDAAQWSASYAICLVRLKKYNEARPVLEKTWERLVAAGVTESPGARPLLEALVEEADASGRDDEAEGWRKRLAALPGAASQPAGSTTAPVIPTTAP